MTKKEETIVFFWVFRQSEKRTLFFFYVNIYLALFAHSEVYTVSPAEAAMGFLDDTGKQIDRS